MKKMRRTLDVMTKEESARQASEESEEEREEQRQDVPVHKKKEGASCTRET